MGYFPRVIVWLCLPPRATPNTPAAAMSTAERLRKKLEKRTEARTKSQAEAEKLLSPEELKKKAAEKAEAELKQKAEESATDVAKIKRLAFDVSTWLLDFDAIHRTVPNTPAAKQIYDELMASCKHHNQTASWSVSLPSLARDLSAHPRTPLVVPCGGVVVERQADDDGEEGEDGSPRSQVCPIPTNNTFAVSARVWSVEDPNLEQRRADEAAQRPHVPRFSTEPTEMWSTLCGRNVTKTIPILERYDVEENDPASKAALFSWSADDHDEFDHRLATPVRACVTAAELLNKSITYGGDAASKVRAAIKLKNEPGVPLHPYASDQLGVIICRAETMLGTDASGFEDQLVAVVHARHCVAHTVLGTPALVGAQRLISRALGSIVVGTVDSAPGDASEPRLSCYRHSQHIVVVMPYSIYDSCMKHLRQQGRLGHAALIPMGQLELVIPKKLTTQGGGGSGTDGQRASATERLPTRVNVVTVYVHFESCPSLLLLGESLSIGTGWRGVMLVLGGEKNYKISASEWNEEANKLQRHCVQMLAEGKFEQLEIDEESGSVNIDKIAIDRRTNPTTITDQRPPVTAST